MFEFMDQKLIIATVMFLFVYGLLDLANQGGKKDSSKNKKHSLGLMYLVIIAMPFISASCSMQDAKESISKFKHDVTLKCFIDEFDYVVSKEEGWSLRANYFTKDSLLIRCDKCEEF
ncbi:hypothetical protein JHD46_05265 [Sulfurimonas sp. SAG-AH-194-C20]|nr:hypothetical protein [Sulfurimonas sp. SAG-AH-194-C20]MDF1879048.1 hypothetical protein [Sulfurimonas sp. SAG-AH-194-C20]